MFLKVVRKKPADTKERMNRQAIKVSYNENRSGGSLGSSPALDTLKSG